MYAREVQFKLDNYRLPNNTDARFCSITNSIIRIDCTLYVLDNPYYGYKINNLSKIALQFKNKTVTLIRLDF